MTVLCTDGCVVLML